MIRNTICSNQAILPGYFPGVLFRLLVEEGHSAEELLRDTKLSAAAFHDDNVRFSFLQHRQFLRNAVRVSGDPHLGIRFGQRINVTSLGILGYAAMSCETLASALATIIKYFKIRAPLLELSLVQEGEVAKVQVDEALDFGDMRYFLLTSALCGIERLLNFYVGGQTIVDRASVACPQPEGWSEVAASVGFPIHFDKSYTELSFRVKHLSRRLPMADPQTEQSTKQICEHMLAKVGSQSGIVSRIREYILEQHGTYPSLEEAAQHLFVSSRTLRRELQKAGTTYQTILDKVRESIAVEYLTATQKPIYQIALELGYDDLSNFGRAFRRWTGKPPSSFRS